MKRVLSSVSVSVLGLVFLLVLAEPLLLQVNKHGMLAAPHDATESKPEETARGYSVLVKDNLLTVYLIDAEFGKVLHSIAKQTGFTVEVDSDVSGRKVTTRFTNVDIERGINRLLMLIDEKNYLFHYDKKGTISKIAVYGADIISVSAPAKPKTPARPQVKREVTPSWRAPRPARQTRPVTARQPSSTPSLQNSKNSQKKAAP